MSYDISDIVVSDALSSAVSLLDALIVQRGLICELCNDDDGLMARADVEKLQQILVAKSRTP